MLHLALIASPAARGVFAVAVLLGVAREGLRVARIGGVGLLVVNCAGEWFGGIVGSAKVWFDDRAIPTSHKW